MDLGLKGKVAMITGASKGLGRAMAKAFGEEGVKLSICARGEAQLKDATAEFQKFGFDTFSMAADVTKAAEMEKWIAETSKRFGGVDIGATLADGDVEPRIPVETLIQRRVIAGKLELVFPFELHRDLIKCGARM